MVAKGGALVWKENAAQNVSVSAMANKSLLVTPGSGARLLMCVTSAHAQNQQLLNAIKYNVCLVMESQSLFLEGVVR
ncbi:hypothetical protein ABFA07_022550 [Porites harrisoni]